MSSFSLAALLNPEPAVTNHDSHHELPRKTSLPTQVRSPVESDATLSRVVSAPQPHPYQPHPDSAQHAAEALATLHASDAPLPTHYYGYTAVTDSTHESLPIEHRRSSIELPPPTPTARKPSSPTLEQYHVSSRSPEQRKHSIAHMAQPTLTLAPLQHITSPEQERRPSDVHHYPANMNLDTQPQKSEMAKPSTNVYAEAKLPVQEMSQNTASGKVELADQGMPSMSVPLDGAIGSPPPIKSEMMATPHTSPPVDARRPSIPHLDAEGHTPKAISSLKHEHSVNTQSPLRESSVPVLSTEPSVAETTISKKRPAPSKKKGMATMTKKTVPPTKKRKLESKRSETPASRKIKMPAFKNGSSFSGTPANSSPARSTRSNSDDPEDEQYGSDEEADEDEDVEGSGDVYCICRKPDNGTFMIGCDGICDDWFHGKCVEIAERDKNLIDKYLCPGCTAKGVGRTTWKRICRRSGCRMPARVVGKKGEKGWSKYCSEECGVLYFREMVGKSRGREDIARQRSSRRKASVSSTAAEEIIGARGGALAAGEVKRLIETSKTAEDFKRLGEGVLSPPATPDGKESSDSTTSNSAANPQLTEAENAALNRIHEQKEEARRRHGLLKDRMKFITMAKQAAGRMASEKELKPKDYCGYDPRLEWTLEEFAAWRESGAGKRAFELDMLTVENSGANSHDGINGKGDDEGGGDEAAMANGDEENVYSQLQVCHRKKCARHLEWNKLAVDDVRFEMGDNSDRMRALDRKEREMKEAAGMRGKAGGRGNILGEGSVEVFGDLGEGEEGVRGNGVLGSTALRTAGEDVEMGDGGKAQIPVQAPTVDESVSIHELGAEAAVPPPTSESMPADGMAA
ncbi:hypothetical protein LTR62_002142 [Meristemomyces frigidus]|uniref:PHD-type domain-containing protein n=1 Tax=Meristemomyces frigidus TaxID=1508187 RepID=A0AAN7YM33_9PEZI|nr:hypothetical protein LTR62_002142 [Meristemomyces frigidus]